MNKFFLLIIFIFCSFVLFSNRLFGKEEKDNTEKKRVLQEYFAPDIPEKAFFCEEEIDLTNYYLRERFDRELVSFSYWHSQVFMIIKRANKYFPIIEPILKSEGIPDDFKYLALIESNLDQRAISPAKAAGIWQLLPETAKEYGLQVSDDVDERYNIEKATVAACKYLKKMQEQIGSWALAAAAYNTGRTRVLRQIEIQQTNNYFDMLFSEETNRYVFRIIMAKYILNDPQKFGFNLKKENLYYLVDYNVVNVDTTIPNLTDFAKRYGINYQLLKDANPWLRTNKLENKLKQEYQIKIPKKDAIRVNPDSFYIHQKNWVINP